MSANKKFNEWIASQTEEDWDRIMEKVLKELVREDLIEFVRKIIRKVN